jgi:hypothetical protein
MTSCCEGVTEPTEGPVRWSFTMQQGYLRRKPHKPILSTFNENPSPLVAVIA